MLELIRHLAGLGPNGLSTVQIRALFAALWCLMCKPARYLQRFGALRADACVAFFFEGIQAWLAGPFVAPSGELL